MNMKIDIFIKFFNFHRNWKIKLERFPVECHCEAETMTGSGPPFDVAYRHTSRANEKIEENVISAAPNQINKFQ